MRLTCQHLPAACVITIDGEVDINTSPELENYILLVRRSLDDHLVIDTGRMPFLDSSGLAVLLAAAVLAQAHGAAVHLTGLQPRVARILEITGALAAVRTYDHLEQALAAIERMTEPGFTEPGFTEPGHGPA
ncbi:anti-anti-sigma factor [Nonomuraea thailandensis]|uniref:Anti-sigma factor antagonist n=1 Tax=Nonomuraea thailandensis TaxID=1188745 RepID=A0A9X2GEW8_9ACTN|nr:STAS domain-containing protein [Nonomuraea thailandensis]MCP2353388.1 anti-anti-sigma factor [Nonomuraea thailandensis]